MDRIAMERLEFKTQLTQFDLSLYKSKYHSSLLSLCFSFLFFNYYFSFLIFPRLPVFWFLCSSSGRDIVVSFLVKIRGQWHLYI